MFTGRVKQSKATSASGFIGGLVFIGLGVFVAIPKFGAFGVVWTLVAALITAFHGYALFSKRGGALYDIEGESKGSPQRSTAARLTDLDESKKRGLITDAEYQAQRNRIISDI